MSADFVAELRSRLNIAEVVGEYVKLRKQGTNYSGLCPFHAERTPSFSVSEKKGAYYCFGCQKGGDIIAFIQEIQGISFQEAVRHLANKAGVAVPARFGGGSRSAGPASTAEQSAQEVLFKLNRFVAQFYHERLNTPQGAEARQYLLDRGITEETIKSAYLGYAPASWNELYDFLISKKAPLESAVAVGLVREKAADSSGRKHYDMFRNRVMFPIIDRRGRVIGFGGRALPQAQATEGQDPGPKYMNSSESPVFKKSEQFFGLFQAFKHIRDEDRCILVEGYMDCLVLQQSGFGATVATLGTALTETHVAQLKRLTTNVYVIYDGDNAGQAAQSKAMELFLAQGVVVRGVTLPDGLDPDEFVRERGADALASLVSEAPYLLDQKILELKTTTGPSPQERGAALDKILPWIARLPAGTGQMMRLQDLSQHFALAYELLEKRVRDLAAAMPRPQARQMPRGAPVQTVRPRPQNPASVSIERLELRFLELLAKFGTTFASDAGLETAVEGLRDPRTIYLAKVLISAIKDGKTVDVSLVDLIESIDAKTVLTRVLASSPESNQEEWQDLIKQLKRRKWEKRREEIRREIKDADVLGKQDDLLRLMQEFNQIQKVLDRELYNRDDSQSSPEEAR